MRRKGWAGRLLTVFGVAMAALVLLVGAPWIAAIWTSDRAVAALAAQLMLLAAATWAVAVLAF